MANRYMKKKMSLQSLKQPCQFCQYRRRSVLFSYLNSGNICHTFYLFYFVYSTRDQTQISCMQSMCFTVEPHFLPNICYSFYSENIKIHLVTRES